MGSADPYISTLKEYVCTESEYTCTANEYKCTKNEYVCTLNEASLKKAVEELNEDPANRMNDVEAFRNLIRSTASHVVCSMGKSLQIYICFENTYTPSKMDRLTAEK